jgi:hypothetical protein
MDLSTVIGTARWFECVHGTKFDPITVHQSIHYKSHTDEFTTVLVHTGDDTNIKLLFYATVHPPDNGPGRSATCRVSRIKHKF